MINLGDLVVTNLSNESDLLTGYKNLVRKSAVNGERSLSFFVPKQEVNEHAFQLIDMDSSITRDDHDYIVKQMQEWTVGSRPVKKVTALHNFFTILLEDHRYGTLSNGVKTINQIMSFIFTGLPFTFSVIGTFGSEEFEEFGNDNPLALFNHAIDRFEAEFDIVGNDVRLVKKLGSMIDMQFRYNHNIKTFSKDINGKDVYTYIKGYGKKLDDPYILDRTNNYSSRTGSWIDLVDPYHATKVIGATFSYSFTGTKVEFNYYVAVDGGVWEFVLDGENKKNISTYGKTSGPMSTVLFEGLHPTNTHTIVATFKGDDPNHVPSSGKGTSRGYVRYASDKGTYSVYRNRVGDEWYACVAEYTSPEASKYKDKNGNVRLKHAPPYQSDSITKADTLLNKLKKVLKDKPDVTISLEFTILKDAGYTGNPNIGDVVPTIFEPLGIDLDLRIVELEEYLDTNQPPKVTLSTRKQSFVKAVMNYQKAMLDKIYDENSKKLRYNVFDEAVKRATEALNNSLTELEYPVGMGILARDPNNPDRFVVLRSSGIGVTTNGGIDFPDAITPDGVVTNLLTAGQIKTNNIQIIGLDDLFYWDGNYLIAIDANDPNKYTKLNSDGLYAAKGTFTAEREDGLKTIIGGKINQDYNIQGATPPFMVGAEILGRHFKTNESSNSPAICQIFTFKKTAKYLKFQLVIGVDKVGNQARAFVEQTGVPGVWLGSATGTALITDEGEEQWITVDLGVPDGNTFAVYLRLFTNSIDTGAYVRVVRAYLTDF